MQNDDQQIRQLVSTWLNATKNRDLDAILDLITDDVVFLLPGRGPMYRDEFVSLTRASQKMPAPRMDGVSEIQEIQISGDYAFMWTKLSIRITPPVGQLIEREGNTLSVLKRMNGKWLLARDANLLTTQASE